MTRMAELKGKREGEGGTLLVAEPLAVLRLLGVEIW